MVSQEEMVKRYEEGMKSAQAKRRYSDSMKNLRENPMLLAAEMEDEYLRKVTEASTSGYRKRRLMEADFEGMKVTASTVGAERLSSGATKAVPKYRRRLATNYAGYESARQEARAAKKAGAAPMDRVKAAINALKRAAGKPEI